MKTVRENVNIKVQELREDMKKEIAALNHNYSTLHNMVDIIVDVVAKAVGLYSSLVPKFDKMAEVDVTSFGNIDKCLQELKDLMSKYDSSRTLVVSPDFFNEKFRMLESTIHKEFSPLAKFVKFMPMNVPPVSIGVQGG